MKNLERKLYTSESVCAGHPDKVCDQIADAILDAHLTHDPDSRVACEVMAPNDSLIIVGGEITTNKRSKGEIDIEEIVRETIHNIGYNNPFFGLDHTTLKILDLTKQQSPDISRGVTTTKGHEQGAGDQGMMIGFAIDETPQLMPMPIMCAHMICGELERVRIDGTFFWIRPDGKTQVTVEYEEGKPVSIDTIVVSVQHDPKVNQRRISREIKDVVSSIPQIISMITPQTKYLINKTGRFVIGGPAGDAGLTGRKIVVDQYGNGSINFGGRVGGGAFSGKDPSKVDRSAAYMARYIAKNIVAAGIARACEVQLAYAIGVAKPVSVTIKTFGTSLIPEGELSELVRKTFPLKPAGIIDYLQLKRPIYRITASGGHFGREPVNGYFPWEKTDKAEFLRKKVGI